MWRVLILLALTGRALAAGAQGAAPVEGWRRTFFEQPDRALPLLVEAALGHSAEVKALGAEKDITRQDIQIARKGILSSVLLTNSFGYGNIANATVADQTLPTARSSTSAQHYSTGINLNLPLDRLVSRHNLVRRQQLQQQRFEHLEQAQKDAVRQRVIDLYQAVLLGQKILSLRLQAYQSAQLNYQMAEKQFRSGDVTLAEVSLLNDRTLTAAIEQENALSKYATAFLLLEDVTGARIPTLMPQP